VGKDVALTGRDGVAITMATTQMTGRGVLMAVVMALIAAPSVLYAAPGVLREARGGVAPPASGVPRALDACLSSVREITPSFARILVAGAPPAPTFYRATALLYPRRIYPAFPIDYAHAWAVPSTGWRELARLARHDGAAYVFVWSLPLKPSSSGMAATAVRVRCPAGILARVSL